MKHLDQRYNSCKCSIQLSKMMFLCQTCSQQGCRPVGAGIYRGSIWGRSSNLGSLRRAALAGRGSPCLPRWPRSCFVRGPTGQVELKRGDTRGGCLQLSGARTASSIVWKEIHLGKRGVGKNSEIWISTLQKCTFYTHCDNTSSKKIKLGRWGDILLGSDRFSFKKNVVFFYKTRQKNWVISNKTNSEMGLFEQNAFFFFLLTSNQSFFLVMRSLFQFHTISDIIIWWCVVQKNNIK